MIIVLYCALGYWLGLLVRLLVCCAIDYLDYRKLTPYDPHKFQLLFVRCGNKLVPMTGEQLSQEHK